METDSTPGTWLHAIEQSAIEDMPVDVALRRNAEDQQALGSHPQLLRGIVAQGAQQQARRHQQDQANGDLGGQHDPAAATTRLRAAVVLAEVERRTPATGARTALHRGTRLNVKCGENRNDQREQQHRACRELRPVSMPDHGRQQPRGRDGKQPSQHSPRAHQQQALAQQLPEDAVSAPRRSPCAG